MHELDGEPGLGSRVVVVPAHEIDAGERVEVGVGDGGRIERDPESTSGSDARDLVGVEAEVDPHPAHPGFVELSDVVEVQAQTLQGERRDVCAEGETLADVQRAQFVEEGAEPRRLRDVERGEQGVFAGVTASGGHDGVAHLGRVSGVEREQHRGSFRGREERVGWAA